VFLIDPYFALKAAHAAGKVIEVAEKRFGGWSPVKENHNWTFPVEEYRIKPDGEVKKVLVPLLDKLNKWTSNDV